MRSTPTVWFSKSVDSLLVAVAAISAAKFAGSFGAAGIGDDTASAAEAVLGTAKIIGRSILVTSFDSDTWW